VSGEAAREAVVFDIGGSHFRSALWNAASGLREAGRREAINYLNTPHGDPRDLQMALAEWLVSETDRLAGLAAMPVATAAISMGAPVDPHTGLVLQSGPLWGPEAREFDFLAVLTARRPALRWVVANDVTAALLRHVGEAPDPPQGRVLLITVSTGIGARLYDGARGGIPLDPVHGLQGEIGHLPVEARFRDRPVGWRCDCGGDGHLNAYASGRALDALLEVRPAWAPDDLARSAMCGLAAASPAGRRDVFRLGVESADPLALEALDFATRPLARMLTTLLTFDPILESVILTGGVVDAIGDAYLDSLARQFNAAGLFQITPRDPDYLRRRLRRAPADDHGGLIGAGRLALLPAAPYAFE
jgi:glucokinase